MIKFIFFIFIVSCSSFVKKIDTNQDENRPPQTNHKLYQDDQCNKNDQLEFLGGDVYSQEKILQFLQKNQNKKYSPIEIFVINSLFQMLTNPHLSSPQARLQFIWYKDGQYFYHDYYSTSEKAYPYLIGLNDLLIKYNSKYTLPILLKSLENEIQAHLKVNKSLETFLLENKNAILSSPTLVSFYVRGDETLKEGEKLPLITSHKIIEIFQKSDKTTFKTNTDLIQSKYSPRMNTYCNYNLDLYNSSLYLIHDQDVKSNVTGIRFYDQFMLSSATMQFNKIENLENTYFIRGSSSQNASAVCLIKNKYSEMGLISTASRDPAQHIYRLLQDLEDTDSFKTFSRKISHSRYLFLNNPSRIIYESQRDNEKGFDEVLKFQLPIYYADKLGEIWGAFKTNDSTKLFFDNRTKGSIKCKL